jgi:hypothetical protein
MDTKEKLVEKFISGTATEEDYQKYRGLMEGVAIRYWKLSEKFARQKDFANAKLMRERAYAINDEGTDFIVGYFDNFIEQCQARLCAEPAI